jgi:hypothetical protein
VITIQPIHFLYKYLKDIVSKRVDNKIFDRTSPALKSFGIFTIARIWYSGANNVFRVTYTKILKVKRLTDIELPSYMLQNV